MSPGFLMELNGKSHTLNCKTFLGLLREANTGGGPVWQFLNSPLLIFDCKSKGWSPKPLLLTPFPQYNPLQSSISLAPDSPNIFSCKFAFQMQNYRKGKGGASSPMQMGLQDKPAALFFTRLVVGR